MKQIRQLILALILFVPILMSAQSVITGTVVDAVTGDGLPGVTVLVKGTDSGTATDFDGLFTLNIDDDNSIVVFSYVGYNTIEVPASDGMVVQLNESAESLEEVVLIGYGSTTKKDATGAVEKVGTEEFNTGAIASPEQLITGKTAGVNVVPPSGAPGSGGTIKIRGGISSLSASNSPLIVIDGVAIDQNGPALNTINPNDIESFNILKDASATAIYGSRATNGVILITTKSGKMNSDFKVEIASNFSVGTKMNDVDVLSADQYRNIATPDMQPLLGDANTDWQDKIYQTAFGTDNLLTISEGFDHNSFRMSIGYLYQEGILKTSEYNRKTASMNYRHNLFDNTLKIDANIRGTWSQDEFANEGAIGAAATFDPTQSIKSGNEAFGGYWEWLDNEGLPDAQAPRNPVGLLYAQDNHAGTQRYLGNTKFTYNFPFLEGLDVVANFGFDYNEVNGSTYTDPNSGSGARNGGSRGVYDSMRRNTLADIYVNYNNLFNDVHKVDVMLGHSFQQFYRENDSYSINGQGVENDPIQFRTQNSLLSYMARLNYTFDERYLLTFTFRRDGSSRFHEDNRWGNFPSAAVAWNISEESFLEDSTTLSNLKLRLGYGQTGQQEIGNDFAYLPIYTPGTANVSYPFGTVYINTVRPEGYDANIKWEESETYNVGLDYGFLDNRISGSLEYFFRQSSDILSTIAPAAGTNLTNVLFTNIGDLESSGIEFTLNSDIIQQENFNWNIGFNVSYLQNEITKLNVIDDPDSPGLAVGGISGGVGNTIQTHKVGEEQFSYLVYKQVYDEDGNPLENVFEDINGDGVINSDDKHIFHSPNPDYLFGFSSYLNYYNFDFSFTMRAALGNYAYNNVASANGNYNQIFDLGTTRNAHSSILETNFSSGSSEQLLSDYYVQDASFLKMDNLTLGYTFNNLDEGDTGLRIYGTVQNVFVLTDYDGLDPEINGGIDNNFYPRPRTFLVGFNLNF